MRPLSFHVKPSFLIVFLLVCLVLYFGCKHEYQQDFDVELLSTLNAASKTGSYTGYILPESNDYANIPNQDLKNPITSSKS